MLQNVSTYHKMYILFVKSIFISHGVQGVNAVLFELMHLCGHVKAVPLFFWPSLHMYIIQTTRVIFF